MTDIHKKVFGIATFIGGIYYLRFSVLFAVWDGNLPPDYLKAIIYLVISITMFFLFNQRIKYSQRPLVFWAFTVWGIFTLFDFVTRILPAYA